MNTPTDTLEFDGEELFVVEGKLTELQTARTTVNLMCLGLATRGFLIYCYYPRKIKLETGKDVYVDMASKK